MSRDQRLKIDAMLRQPRGESPESIEAIRAEFKAMMAGRIVPDGLHTTQTTLGDRPALKIEPADGPSAGTILYFHGGVWALGSPETALSVAGNLTVRTGFTVLSVDYRLAPEHPFPAAIDDTLSAYRALLDSGHDPSTVNAKNGDLDETYLPAAGDRWSTQDLTANYGTPPTT